MRVGLLVTCLVDLMRPSIGLAAPRLADGGDLRPNLQRYRAGLAELLRNRTVIAMSAVSALRSSTQITLMTFLPLFLAYKYGLDAAGMGLYLSVLSLLGVFSPMIGDALNIPRMRQNGHQIAVSRLGSWPSTSSMARPRLVLVDERPRTLEHRNAVFHEEPHHPVTRDRDREQRDQQTWQEAHRLFVDLCRSLE